MEAANEKRWSVTVSDLQAWTYTGLPDARCVLETLLLLLCVHQPNDAKRYDYHLVYTSFPLAFSYISINSHRHWGCSSVNVL